MTILHTHTHTDPDLLTRLRQMLGSAARADIAVGYFTTKAADAPADTSDAEAEIDHLVYDVYGLTEAEVDAVAAKWVLTRHHNQGHTTFKTALHGKRYN